MHKLEQNKEATCEGKLYRSSQLLWGRCREMENCRKFYKIEVIKDSILHVINITLTIMQSYKFME